MSTAFTHTHTETMLLWRTLQENTAIGCFHRCSGRKNTNRPRLSGKGPDECVALSDSCWISFLMKLQINLTLRRESPAAGRLCRQFGSWWKRQAEQHDQGLACRHLHRWHFYPGGGFRQRGGFGRTRRCRIWTVRGDGELEKAIDLESGG